MLNREKSGISLIVLIISIIIMIILASAVIITLNNGNILSSTSSSRTLYNASELKSEIEMYRNSSITEGKDGIDTFPILKNSDGTYDSIKTRAVADTTYLQSLDTGLKTLLCNLVKDLGGTVSANLNDESNYSDFYFVNDKLINSAKVFDNGIVIFVGNGEYTIISLKAGNYSDVENKSYIVTTISTSKQGII